MERTQASRLWALVVMVASATRGSAGGAAERGGSYQKQDAYTDQDFLDKFDFLESSAPKDGHVSYLNRRSARKAGIAQVQDGNIFLGVDASGVTGGARRKSVRLSSEAVYNSGLFVLSLDHMPTGCGTWPSFWLKGNGASWPQHGGINIIEGVHSMTEVKPSLHTAAKCDQSSVQSHVDFSGVWERGSTKPEANDCSITAPGQWKGQGCEQGGPVASMGKPFNDGGGGTFVTEWAPNSGNIRSWFFQGTALPTDLAAGKPDPESWGKPYSFFRLSEDACSRHHFVNMSIVFDLNLCGSYGDALFKKMCPSEAQMSGNCNEYVSDHPKVMEQAYWSIRSLDVYQWRDAQGGHTTTDGLVTMLDARGAPLPQTASTSVVRTAKVTTPAATKPSATPAAARNPHALTRSSTPPPVAIPGSAMRKIVAAKTGRRSVAASAQETSNYLHDAVLEEKKGGSLISGLLHFFQPAAQTNAAVVQRTVGGSGVLNARTIGKTVAGGPLHAPKIAPSASLYCCSAAVALGIFAFWAKVGRLTSAFERRHDGQRVSASQEESPSLHEEWDGMSSRLSVSSSQVSGSRNSSPIHYTIHDGDDASEALQSSDAHPATIHGYPGCGIRSSERCPLDRSSGDTQPALLEFLESDGGQDA